MSRTGNHGKLYWIVGALLAAVLVGSQLPALSDLLSGTTSLTTPESPSSWFCPLGEDSTCAKLSGNLKSKDDATGGRAGDKVNTLIAKMVSNHAA